MALSAVGCSATATTPGTGGTSGEPQAGSGGGLPLNPGGGTATGGVAEGICPAGQVACDGVCVSPATDVTHCGGCGRTCGVGQVCAGGVCTCPEGMLGCGACVDPAADSNNCGGCGVVCPSGSTCQDGQCSCVRGRVNCGGECVNVRTDGNNCGMCGTVCEAGQVCSAGRCGAQCTAPGQTACGSSCVSLMDDASNCGACGVICTGGRSCQNGVCACSVGRVVCDGECVSLWTSASNCGACGVVCGAQQSCESGMCVDAGASGSGGDSGQPITGGSSAGGFSAGGSGAGGGAASGGSVTGAGGGAASGGSVTGTGGSAGEGASVGTGGDGSGECAPFSFFVTSLAALQRESESATGFGGDLGGLAGADEVCRRIAEHSLPCAGQRQWRAFLSTSAQDAIDRVGDGPWYDRLGRTVALSPEDLANARPANADPEIVDDLPNEDGVQNHAPEGATVDNHDTLTGSDSNGRLYGVDATCNDWTSSAESGSPRVGHSWPDGPLDHWINAMSAPGCAPGVNAADSNSAGSCVGCSGGYGGFYCFALAP